MAGVKTQKGGPRVEPRWTVRACYLCEPKIAAAKEAVNILRFVYPEGRRREFRSWAHRGCIK